jgi:hypothetical protein
MYKLHLRLSCAIALSALHTLASADVANGKTLHNANCIQCHVSMKGGDGSGIYTRSDRRVKDLAGLSKQVNRCTSSLGLLWKDKEHQDVVDYLNSTFYKFTTKP